MAYSDTKKIERYNCDGSTVGFPITFSYLENDHIRVTHYDHLSQDEFVLVPNVDYTIVNDVVTTSEAYPVGDRISLSRVIPLNQEIDLQANSSLSPETLEKGLDKAMMAVQQLSEQLDRGVKTAITDNEGEMILPPKQVRANAYLHFDENGDPDAHTGPVPRIYDPYYRFMKDDLTQSEGELWRSKVDYNTGNPLPSVDVGENEYWILKKTGGSSEIDGQLGVDAAIGTVMCFDGSTGKLIAADNRTLAKALATGLLTKTGAADDYRSCMKGGKLTGLTGLTPGMQYFLGHDGAIIPMGAIGHNEYTVYVGTAINETTIDIAITSPDFRDFTRDGKHVGEVFLTSVPYELPGCQWAAYEMLKQSEYPELFSRIGHLYAKTNADMLAAEAAGKFYKPDGMYLFPRAGRTYLIDSAAFSGTTLIVTHGLKTDGSQNGRPVKIVARPGDSPVFPSGIAECEQYYIAVVDENTLRLYTTEADAVTNDGLTNIVTFGGAPMGSFYLSTMGCYQADAFQGHRIQDWGSGTDYNDGSGGPTSGDNIAQNSYPGPDVKVDMALQSIEPDLHGNGDPRVTNETRGAYVGLGMQIKVAGTATTGETYDTLKFDTGWATPADWTNAVETINHNLNADASGLVFEGWLKCDEYGEQRILFSDTYVYTQSNYGACIESDGVDSVKLRFFALGPYFYNTATGTGVPAGSVTNPKYRVVVYKPDLFTKVKEVIDQEWDLNGAGAIEHALPHPQDVASILLRWINGKYGIDYVTFAPGVDINGIDAGEYILTGNGVMELIPNAARTAYTTKIDATRRMICREEQPSGTNGGSTATGVEYTRTLNTVTYNTIPSASLAANQITLPAGTYRIRASAPAAAAHGHRIRLYNVTDGATEVLGTTQYSAYAGGNADTLLNERSMLDGIFTITEQKVFEIRHKIGYGRATTGLGYPAGTGENEIFTEVTLERV